MITGVTRLCQQRAQCPRHLELVDGPDAVPVERERPGPLSLIARSLTRLTKMSSSELWFVFRSLNPIPSSLSRRSSVEIRCGVRERRRCIPARGRPPSGSAANPQARRESPSSVPADCSVSCFLPSFFINAVFSSTRISSPLLDDADPVGHFLGFLDVVRGQDDGDAAVAQPRAPVPTCRAAVRRRRPRSAHPGTGSPARAPAPSRSSRGASCRPTTS